MEDLYEDMCDGACVCALAAFYRPNEISLRGFTYRFVRILFEMCDQFLNTR